LVGEANYKGNETAITRKPGTVVAVIHGVLKNVEDYLGKSGDRIKRLRTNRQPDLQFLLRRASFLTLFMRQSMRRGERDRIDPTLILSGSRIPHPSKHVRGLDYPELTTVAKKSK